MKKLIALVLVTLIALSSVTVAMAEATKFETKLAGGMEYDTAKWYGSATNRAFLTVLLALDLYLADEELGDKALTAARTGLSYCAKDSEDDVVSAFFAYDKTVMIVLFDPADKVAAYSLNELSISSDIDESTLSTLMDGMVSKGLLESCYQNATSDVDDAISTISTALSSED